MKMLFLGADEGLIKFDIPDEVAKAGIEASVGWMVFHEGWALWSTPALVSFKVPQGIVGFLYLAPEHQGAHRFDLLFLGDFDKKEIRKLGEEWDESEQRGSDTYRQEWHQEMVNWWRKRFGLGPEKIKDLPGLLN